MNIIKIADIKSSEVDEYIRENYEFFKNLYCFCINWKYILRFEDVEKLAVLREVDVLNEYINLSLMSDDEIIKLFTRNEITYGTAQEYIFNGLVDIELTEKANSFSKYKEYNSFSPDDSELTIEEIKKFRTWLANTLLGLLSTEEDIEYETIEMLKYYANETTDDTINHLSHFYLEQHIGITTSPTVQSCSCNATAASVLLANGVVSNCDPIYMYKKSLYNYMVKTFSDIHFWTERESEFLSMFKKYIDSIIKLNLPLTSSPYISELYDCNCLTTTDSAQERLMAILKNLSTALGYMIEEKISGHKNFIGDTLNQWSSKLYEIMRW